MYDPGEVGEFYNCAFVPSADEAAAERMMSASTSSPPPSSPYAMRTSPIIIQGPPAYTTPTMRARVLPTFYAGESHEFSPCANLEEVGWINPRSPRIMEMGAWTATAPPMPVYDTIHHSHILYPIRRSPFFDYEFPAAEVNHEGATFVQLRDRSPVPLSDNRGLCETMDYHQNGENYDNFQAVVSVAEEEPISLKHSKHRNKEKSGKEGKKVKKEKKSKDDRGILDLKSKFMKGKKEKKEKAAAEMMEMVKGEAAKASDKSSKDAKKKKRLRFSAIIDDRTPAYGSRSDPSDIDNVLTVKESDSGVNFLLSMDDSPDEIPFSREYNRSAKIAPMLHIRDDLSLPDFGMSDDVLPDERTRANSAPLCEESDGRATNDTCVVETLRRSSPKLCAKDENFRTRSPLVKEENTESPYSVGDRRVNENGQRVTDEQAKDRLRSSPARDNLYKGDRLEAAFLPCGEAILVKNTNGDNEVKESLYFYSNDNSSNPVGILTSISTASEEFNVSFDDQELKIGMQELNLEKPLSLTSPVARTNFKTDFDVKQKVDVATQTDFGDSPKGDGKDDDEEVEEEEEEEDEEEDIDICGTIHAWTQTLEEDSLFGSEIRLTPEETIYEPCCSFLDKDYNVVRVDQGVNCPDVCKDAQEAQDIYSDSIYVNECDGFGMTNLEHEYLLKEAVPFEGYLPPVEQVSEPFLDARSRLCDTDDDDSERHSLHYAECLELSSVDEGCILQESAEEFTVKWDNQPRRALSATLVPSQKSLLDQRHLSLMILPQGRFVDLRDDVIRVKSPSKISLPSTPQIDVPSDDMRSRLNAGEGLNQMSAILGEQLKANVNLHDNKPGTAQKCLIEKLMDCTGAGCQINSEAHNENVYRAEVSHVGTSPVMSSLPNIPLFNDGHINRHKCIAECKKALLVCECFWREDATNGMTSAAKTEENKEVEGLVKDIADNLLDYMKEISHHVVKHPSRSNLKNVETSPEETSMADSGTQADLLDKWDGEENLEPISSRRTVENVTSFLFQQEPKENSMQPLESHNETQTEDGAMDHTPASTSTTPQESQSTSDDQNSRSPRSPRSEEFEEPPAISDETPANITLSFNDMCKIDEINIEKACTLNADGNFMIEIEGDSVEDDSVHVKLTAERRSPSKKRFENGSSQTEEALLTPRAIDLKDLARLNLNMRLHECLAECDSATTTSTSLFPMDEASKVDSGDESDDGVGEKEEERTGRESALLGTDYIDNLAQQLKEQLPAMFNSCAQIIQNRTAEQLVEPKYKSLPNTYGQTGEDHISGATLKTPGADEHPSMSPRDTTPENGSVEPRISFESLKECSDQDERDNCRSQSKGQSNTKSESGPSSSESTGLRTDFGSQTENFTINAGTQTAICSLARTNNHGGKEVLVSCFGRELDLSEANVTRLESTSNQSTNPSLEDSREPSEATSSEGSLLLNRRNNLWNRITGSRVRRLQLVNAVERIMAYRTINGNEGLARIDLINLDLDMWPLEAIAHVLYLIVVLAFFFILTALLSFLNSIRN